MLFISRTSYQMCLFEFIRVEGGATFIKYFKGGAQAINVWEHLYQGVGSDTFHSTLTLVAIHSDIPHHFLI
jgi:hypothetical protein